MLKKAKTRQEPDSAYPAPTASCAEMNMSSGQVHTWDSLDIQSHHSLDEGDRDGP